VRRASIFDLLSVAHDLKVRVPCYPGQALQYLLRRNRDSLLPLLYRQRRHENAGLFQLLPQHDMVLLVQMKMAVAHQHVPVQLLDVLVLTVQDHRRFARFQGEGSVLQHVVIRQRVDQGARDQHT